MQCYRIVSCVMLSAFLWSGCSSETSTAPRPMKSGKQDAGESIVGSPSALPRATGGDDVDYESGGDYENGGDYDADDDYGDDGDYGSDGDYENGGDYEGAGDSGEHWGSDDGFDESGNAGFMNANWPEEQTDEHIEKFRGCAKECNPSGSEEAEVDTRCIQACVNRPPPPEQGRCESERGCA